MEVEETLEDSDCVLNQKNGSLVVHTLINTVNDEFECGSIEKAVRLLNAHPVHQLKNNLVSGRIEKWKIMELIVDIFVNIFVHIIYLSKFNRVYLSQPLMFNMRICDNSVMFTIIYSSLTVRLLLVV